ncbi:hypothetical protein LCGC14_2422600 [marine sediment metagenome]|uniref:Uncharacterized protein n=1 Tax=marine sediment metagenome TaxID=412755 RepID=A0A0F9E1E0_9ZZZZ
MDQASRKFRQGDVRGGLAKAMRAQKGLRAAIQQMKIGQYESLQAAVAAAQDGVAALAANQHRVSEGTRRIGQKVNQMTGKPGQGKPGQGKPGQGKPGQGKPGKGDGERTPSQQDVVKAMGRDPGIGPKLKGLAKQQAGLAKDLGPFMEYVDELNKWAGKARKDQVAGSLKDVVGDLRGDDTSQKMINAAVGLASQDLGGARDAQKEVAAALRKAATGLQEAKDMLAGSPTGVLRQAARDAKEIGSRVQSIAGLGQPGQGQPGQGQPGQGQPGQGQPGKGQPGKGQPGKGQPGQGKPGEGKPGEGKPGEGKPGEGKPGEGKPGEGKPGEITKKILAALQNEVSARGEKK